MRFFQAFLLAVISGTIISMPAAANPTNLEDELSQGFYEHAAKAQLHRWHQFFDNPDVGVDNLLNILSPEIEITSSAGTELIGYDAITARIAETPGSWQNAHFVQKADVDIGTEGAIQISASSIFENIGMDEGDALSVFDAQYQMVLEPSDELLPHFTKIHTTLTERRTHSEFSSSYAENRLKSLVHYWLAILEQPKLDPSPAAEIFAEAFSLNFSTGVITTYDDFQTWYNGRAGPVAISTHGVEAFSFEEIAPNQYRVNVEFPWTGLLKDGTLMKARTLHTWQVVDVPTDRFAKIEIMDVDVLEPFAPFTPK